MTAAGARGDDRTARIRYPSSAAASRACCRRRGPRRRRRRSDFVREGVTLELPCSLPGTYPGVQGSGNKMGGSEVHGPRATTSLAPAGSPWGGA
ncbi:hypothetical protein PG984_015163 [Apiospora sp. TS-2023a]